MSQFTKEEEELFKKVAMQRLQQEMERQTTSMLTHSAAPEAKPSSSPQALFRSGGELREMPPLLGGLMAAGAGTEDVLTNIGEISGLIGPEKAKERRERNEMFRRYSPFGTFVGETATSSLPSMAVGGPAGFAGRFFGANPAVVRAATEGAISGAVTSTPEERREGAFFGGLTATAFPVVGGTLRRGVKGVDMTDAARLLADKGVTLTPGQLEPDSNWAMLEESMARLPLLGKKVTRARQRGLREAQGVVAQEAAPPGFSVKPEDNVNDLADQLVGAYNDAYEVGKGYPMRPVIMQEGKDIPLSSVFRVAKNAPADDASIIYANRVLDNELSFIRSKGNQLKSDDLFEVRSNIRKEIRKINKSQNAPFKAAELLSQAEDQIERAIQSQLSGDVLSAVGAVDRQYRKYKTFERAINKAADRPEGFTPAEFSRAVRETTESDTTYARGGGSMRDLSRAFSETFPGRQPQTGASLPSSIPGAVAGAFTFPIYGESGAYSGLRRALTGSTRLQRATREAVEKALADYERKFGKLSDADRQAMATVIRSGLGVYGASERPIPIATTGGLLE